MSLGVESEGEKTGCFNNILMVPGSEGPGPTDLRSDLRDVALTSETGRVRVSRWCVVHVVLSCHPGQVARQLRVDDRVL